MLFIQLLLQFSRVKLGSLEALLHPAEHLDRRPPWTAEGRTMQEQLSRSRDWVPIIMDVRNTKLKCVHQALTKRTAQSPVHGDCPTKLKK